VNAALVRRALANLLSNASRYTPAGRTISIQLSTVAATSSDERVAITVVNPGEGIDPVVLPRLFERFFRADTSRQGSAEHHGLGLAIVRAIARMHGGDAFAASAGCITKVGFTLRTAEASPLPGDGAIEPHGDP